MTWGDTGQAPLSMGSSTQEYWSGLPFPSTQPRDQTHISYVFCMHRWIPYHWHQLGSPNVYDTLLLAVLLVFCYFIRLVSCVIKCVTESQMIRCFEMIDQIYSSIRSLIENSVKTTDMGKSNKREPRNEHSKHCGQLGHRMPPKPWL